MDGRYVLRKQPNVFGAIITGFKSLSTHIYLLLFPLGLDILLLFGPRFTISALTGKFFAMLTPYLESSAELKQIWSDMSASLSSFFKSYSLSSALRSYPLGVPSLLSGQVFMANPFGALPEIILNTEAQALKYLLIFGAFGALLGILYFYGCALPPLREFNKQPSKSTLSSIGSLLLLPVLFWVGLVAISFPVSLIVSLLSLISPFLGLLAYFFCAMIAISLSLPLLFAPHAVILLNQNIWQGIRSSIRYIRPYYSATSLFVILSVLLSYLTNLLWQSAGTNSLMVFVVIFGHALITTALLLASFYYFIRVIEMNRETDLAKQALENVL